MSTRRIQISLNEEVDDALAREALARHTSKAALIREYVGQHLSLPAPDASDPSPAFVGAYDGEFDESQRIDDVVSGQ